MNNFINFHSVDFPLKEHESVRKLQEQVLTKKENVRDFFQSLVRNKITIIDCTKINKHWQKQIWQTFPHGVFKGLKKNWLLSHVTPSSAPTNLSIYWEKKTHCVFLSQRPYQSLLIVNSWETLNFLCFYFVLVSARSVQERHYRRLRPCLLIS